jgi:hypothetical protein
VKITRGQLHDLVARSAVEKPKFREMLIADPKLMLERVLGHGLGKVTVKAVMETPDTMYVVVPHVASDGELSDTDLEHIATGILDNMNAACEVSGGLSLLSSRVAIDMG